MQGICTTVIFIKEDIYDLCPTCINIHAARDFIGFQINGLGTAFRICIPAHELIAFIFRNLDIQKLLLRSECRIGKLIIGLVFIPKQIDFLSVCARTLPVGCGTLCRCKMYGHIAGPVCIKGNICFQGISKCIRFPCKIRSGIPATEGQALNHRLLRFCCFLIFCKICSLIGSIAFVLIEIGNGMQPVCLQGNRKAFCRHHKAYHVIFYRKFCIFVFTDCFQSAIALFQIYFQGNKGARFDSL